MPLGLAPAVLYEQSTLPMRAGDVAVLLTDGVAEAQNEQRVLLGFSRIESMLRSGASARTLADTAQLHGQNDDLTAISIEREPAPKNDRAAMRFDQPASGSSVRG
jgi:serine phosphatase RsbU (regulator of sigma subunit)